MRDGGFETRSGSPLDPLLRELLNFGVAEHDPVDGSWRLTESAQRRLGELASPRPPAEKLIYFGHRCAACGQLRPTRLRTQGLVCDDCTSREPTEWAGPLAGGATSGMTA